MAGAFEVAREWGGRLRPVVFTTPKLLLPASTISFLHYAGVPTRFEIDAHQRVRFDFLTTTVNLAAVWGDSMPDYSFPVGWGRLWRIGDITYTQAAAWLCVEELTGRVVAVDVDIDDPLYPVNGSVEAMVRCMRVLIDWSRSTDGSLAQAAALRSALAAAPGLAAGEAEHFWLPLVEEAVESGCDRFGVSFE
jgi:hypothetical protein